MDEARAILEAKRLLIESEAGKTRPVNLATIITELGLKATYKEDLTDYALLNPMDKTIYVLKENHQIKFLLKKRKKQMGLPLNYLCHTKRLKI